MSQASLNPSPSASQFPSRSNSISRVSMATDSRPNTGDTRRSVFSSLFGGGGGGGGGGKKSNRGSLMGGTRSGVMTGVQTPTRGGGGSVYGGGSYYDEDEDYQHESIPEEELEAPGEEDEEDYEQIEASITCMALHPTEPIIAVGCSPDIIKIWNIKQHKFDAGNNHSGRITAMAFNTDGTYLVTAASWESPSVGWTHSTRLWSVDRRTHSIIPPVGLIGQEDLEMPDEECAGPPVPNLPRLTGNAIRLALQNAQRAADDRGCSLNATIAMGFISQGVMDGKASTEDLLANTGAPPLQQLHQDPITCVAFMPLDENPCIRMLDEHGITGTVIFATASQDRTVRVWCYDRMSDCTVHVLRQHQAEVTCVSFSPDGFMLMSGSLDGSVICWRISLEPVYEAPRGAASSGSGLIHTGGDDADMNGVSGDGGASDQHTGPMVTCVPIIVQNLKFDCFATNSIQPLLEPVYTLQFFPVIHTFGRYPEYTVAVGTSGSLILLRAHAMRVHESPLTNIPQFLRVCRNLQRHSRQVKTNTSMHARDLDDDDDHKSEDASNKNRAPLRRRARDYNTGANGGGSGTGSGTKTKSLGLKPNFLQLSEVYRHAIDPNRYGSIRSLSVELHPLDRAMAYDLEDSLDSKHLERDLLSVKERHVKILLTNHENQGHTLAWVLNEDIDRRTALPVISAHFCVLGKQNRVSPVASSSISGGGHGTGSAVIPNGTASYDGGNFLGNYCEQVLIPSIALRKKFDKFRLQRVGSNQIMCFTLNCTKDETFDPLSPPSQEEQGNGVWAMKFNIEASVDFPGDLEPTIASKVAYDAMMAEVEERRKKLGVGSGSTSSSILLTKTLRGNANPDFIGHLANGYEIEFDLPAFVAQLHPMGTTMNEAMRLSEHQRVMGIKVFKYPAPRKVFVDIEQKTTAGKGKAKVLSTLDTSGFATADIDGNNSGGGGGLKSNSSGFGKSSSSSSSSSKDDTSSSSTLVGGDAGLASSKHLIAGDEDEFGADGEIGRMTHGGNGKRHKSNTIRYKQGRASNNSTLSAVASGSRPKSKHHHHRRRDDSDDSSSSASSSSDSSSDDESDLPTGFGTSNGRSQSPDGESNVVHWQSSTAKRSSSSVSSFATSSTSASLSLSSTSFTPSGSKRIGQSKLAQFRDQALVDLAPKKKAGLFGGTEDSEDITNKEKILHDQKDAYGQTSNHRSQCANPKECTIQ